MNYDVCVVGTCSLDRMFYENKNGTYGSKPDEAVPGGKGSNQAVAASRAGAKTTIITKVGKNEIGKNIFNNLIKNGVDASNVEIIPNFIDSSSDIFISKDGNNDIKRVDGSLDKFAPDMIDKYSDVILNSKIIVCQLKVPKEFTEKLINFCYDNKKFLILTPCRPEKLSIVKDPSNIDLINKVSLITCNKDEFKILFGTEDIEKTVKLFPNKLIVTLGKDGLIYFDGNNIVKLPAIPTNVVDTVGAGDTLCGNLACSLSKKEDLKSSLEKAMYASAYKIQFHNAQAGMPTKECLHNYIKSFQCEQCK